jgi:hypothetical protein
MRWIAPALGGLAVALACGGAAWGQKAPARRARKAEAPALTRCVQFREEDHPDRAERVLTLENGCEVSLRCTIEWTIACQPAGVGNRSRSEEEETIPAGSNMTCRASAERCGESGYVIEPPRWRCRGLLPRTAAR